MIDPAAPVRPGGTAPHALVTDIEGPVIDERQRHHLGRVRRLREGDPLSVTDGRGAWRWCRFGPELALDGPVVVDAEPEPSLTVGFALVKGERPELVVQKLTELGVDVIAPFLSARSVVRWDEDRRSRNDERLRAIAVEASLQSRRTWFPAVLPVTTFDELVATTPGVHMAERDGGVLDATVRCVLVGPEGGWDPGELRFPTVGLGGTVLRAETAAIAAGVRLVAARGGAC